MDVDPVVAHRLAETARRQGGVLTRSDVLAIGGDAALLKRRLRSRAWVPLLRGSYLTDPRLDGPSLRRAWGWSAVLTVDGAVLAGRTAAALHGLEGVPSCGKVEVAVDRFVDPGRRALRVRQSAVAVEDVVDLGGLAATSLPLTLSDLVPELAPLDALAVLDSALRRGRLSPMALAAAAGRVRGRRGCVAVRDLWAAADARAESPLESRARWRCLDAGLVPDDLQHEVRDEHGHLLARADMLFRRRRDRAGGALLLEADGHGPHDAPEALYRDRWRANTLVALGYAVVRCTWADTERPWVIPQMVHRAL